MDSPNPRALAPAATPPPADALPSALEELSLCVLLNRAAVLEACGMLLASCLASPDAIKEQAFASAEKVRSDWK